MKSYKDIINNNESHDDYIRGIIYLNDDYVDVIIKNVIETKFEDLYNTYLKYLNIKFNFFNYYHKYRNPKSYAEFNTLSHEFMNDILNYNEDIYYIDVDVIYSKSPLVFIESDLEVSYEENLIDYVCFFGKKRFILYKNDDFKTKVIKFKNKIDNIYREKYESKLADIKRLIRNDKLSEIL